MHPKNGTCVYRTKEPKAATMHQSFCLTSIQLDEISRDYGGWTLDPLGGSGGTLPWKKTLYILELNESGARLRDWSIILIISSRRLRITVVKMYISSYVNFLFFQESIKCETYPHIELIDLFFHKYMADSVRRDHKKLASLKFKN